MCMMRARTGADGTVYLAFRSAEKNIRDFYVLKAAGGENRFTAIRVNRDNWLFKECPMCGPELTVGPGWPPAVRFHVAAQGLLERLRRRRFGRFQRHVATPGNQS